MAGRDDYANLTRSFQPKIVPPIAVQEAQAETLTLPGAPNMTTDARSESGTAGASVGPTLPTHVDLQGGDSSQVPSGPDINADAGGAKHEHYWIHTVTETIDRGNADFEASSIPLTADTPIRLFGLDDLRSRATVLILTEDTDTNVYFGKRDRIVGADPASAFGPMPVGSSLDFRSRNEAWIISIGGNARVSIIEYHSEPTSGTLGKKTVG